MGITGLWKAVSEDGRRCSLMEISSLHKKQDTNHGSLCLGVDISILMAECTSATLSAGVNGQLHGAGLYIFFHKLAAFLRLPVSLVFVFDGPGRPKNKRGHSVVNRSLWWKNLAPDLIRYFGYHVHQAPGEAEAELAMLNRFGLIDGVITSDSDVLVFGAQVVYRTIPSSERKFDDEFTHYSSTELRFTEGGLILFSLLVGGDYDSGVKGCGTAYAYGLAQLCGFGDQLVHAARTLDQEAFNVFIAGWRLDLCLELESNSKGFLPRRSRPLARNVPNTFPERDTLELYMNPLTSWTTTPPQIPTSRWIPRMPSIVNLTKFCSDHLGWNTEEILKTKFGNILWEGVFLQMVYLPIGVYDPFRKLLATPNAQAKVLKAVRKSRKGKFASKADTMQPRLTVSAENFIALMRRGFSATDSDTFKVWVVEDLLPAGVLDVIGSKFADSSIALRDTATASSTSGHSSGIPASSTACSERLPQPRLGIRDLTRQNWQLRRAAVQERPKEIIDLTLDED